MNTDEKVVLLRAMVESDESEFILLSYLLSAKHIILNRMYQYNIPDDEFDALELPSKYAMKQIRIAAYLMNKRGAEGETQHIENGIHRNYKNADVPNEMLFDVLPMVGLLR